MAVAGVRLGSTVAVASGVAVRVASAAWSPPAPQAASRLPRLTLPAAASTCRRFILLVMAASLAGEPVSLLGAS